MTEPPAPSPLFIQSILSSLAYWQQRTQPLDAATIQRLDNSTHAKMAALDGLENTVNRTLTLSVNHSARLELLDWRLEMKTLSLEGRLGALDVDRLDFRLSGGLVVAHAWT